MPPWRQLTVLLVPAMLLTACGVPASDTKVTSPQPVASASATTPDLATFYDQKVEWKNCGSAECADIVVPLDYGNPGGETVTLAASRLAATGDKIGTLFVNPGGPGGSAADYARAADFVVTPAIREHYDIVGVDPRGVGASDPVRCSTDQELDDFLALDGTPDSPEEEAQAIQESAGLGRNCALRAGAIYEHMGTVDSARDLDIARAVVGDAAFNYLGKSYGTMLGATYAELFPERVGRMVLDGALPAGLDIAEVSEGQAEAFEVALRDFVEDCLTHDDCPVDGTVDEGVQQIRDWIQGLDSDPIQAGDRTVNEPVAAYALLSYLYFPASDYDDLRPALGSAMRDGDVGALLGLLDARISRGPDGRYEDNSSDAFYSVSCTDRPFTGTDDDVRAYAEEWSKTAPTFGEALAWGMLPCRNWPATAAPVTETRASGSNPILVVSTKNDPATPYEWGVRLADELENATLLAWDGFGHTAYFEQSDCINEAVDAYLLAGTLPEDGFLCE